MAASNEKARQNYVAKMNLLSSQLHDLQKTFSELVSSVGEINKMVGVVRDISGKTDLLALNASIEAARAGQAGRGFAIVAHEVARLAEKSQESIQNVEGASDLLEDKIQCLSEKLMQSIETLAVLESRTRKGPSDQNASQKVA